jgi:hypothetical protein
VGKSTRPQWVESTALVRFCLGVIDSTFRKSERDQVAEVSVATGTALDQIDL